MLLLGLISIFRESSFLILISPVAPFSIRWIVIDPISFAILSTPAEICGLCAKLVYPEHVNVSNDSGEQSHTADEFALRFSCGSARAVGRLFFLLRFPTSPFLFLCVPCFQDIEYMQKQRRQSSQSAAADVFFRIAPYRRFFQWR